MLCWTPVSAWQLFTWSNSTKETRVKRKMYEICSKLIKVNNKDTRRTLLTLFWCFFWFFLFCFFFLRGKGGFSCWLQTGKCLLGKNYYWTLHMANKKLLKVSNEDLWTTPSKCLKLTFKIREWRHDSFVKFVYFSLFLV